MANRKMEAMIVVGLIALYGAAIGMMAWWACQDPPPADKAVHVVVITEDDPRWDCATMGNRVCGVNPETWYAAGEWVGICVVMLPGGAR